MGMKNLRPGDGWISIGSKRKGFLNRRKQERSDCISEGSNEWKEENRDAKRVGMI